MSYYSIAVHGGAGTILRGEMSQEKERTYREGLSASLDAGIAILEKGGKALDAVEASVMAFEDNPLFNAGKGSVFTHDGHIELDAAIMAGKDRSAGAVGGVRFIKNPIQLARIIMEQSPHVFMYGAGAEEFARINNLPVEPAEYFLTEHRQQQWLKLRDTEQMALDHTSEKKFGTVGAVARDRQGYLAAATSTGGMTNKRFGRIGDSPVIGAGTYADESCAVSCTGHGELFIRAVAAHSVAMLMKHGGLSLAEACRRVVMEDLLELGGEGGLIAVDKQGNVELLFNSEGMYRGSFESNSGIRNIGIYGD